jgi:hypothetical protein
VFIHRIFIYGYWKLKIDNYQLQVTNYQLNKVYLKQAEITIVKIVTFRVVSEVKP